MDIASYYDTLPTVKVLKWLLHQGVDAALFMAIARHQLLVSIVVCMGPSNEIIRCRGSDGLTGSVLARLLARIPVESTFRILGPSLHDEAFYAGCPEHVGNADEPKLAAASWVDNLYCFSAHAAGATLNAELIAAHLHDEWGLSIKQGSKILLLPAGAEVDACIGSDWKLHLEHMEVLGWPIQANGGHGEAWTVMTRKCWSAFWCNCRCREWRKLGMRRRLI